MSKLKMGELNQSKIQNTNRKNFIEYAHPHIQKNSLKGHTWKDTCGPQKIPLFQLLKAKKQNAVQIKHQTTPNSGDRAELRPFQYTLTEFSDLFSF
jgi:hypothetical protein